MDWFTIIIIFLLLLAIFTILLMYNKHVINNKSINFDPNIKDSVGYKTIKIYYSKDISPSKCYPDTLKNESPILNDIELLLNDYQKQNLDRCVILFDENPTRATYNKINALF